MGGRKWFGSLRRGPLGESLKKALKHIKDPRKLSRLLTAVLGYAKKNRKVVETFRNDVFLLWEMLNAWRKGEYKAIPKQTLLLITAALICFVSPVDLIPDALPGGFLDDAAVITWVIDSVRSDTEAFKAWKEGRDGSPEQGPD